MTITSSLSLQTVRPEFTANSFTPPDQMLPDVLRLSNGGYVVAYNNYDSADGVIMLDFYDSNSNPTTGMCVPHGSLANTSASGAPSLTQLANGNVLVVWNNVDPANLGIKAAMFTPNGENIGTEMALISGQNSDPHIEALIDGGFVMSYARQNHIYAVVFDADGNTDGSGAYGNLDITPGNHTVSAPTSAVLGNGNFVVTWSSYTIGGTIELHARVCAPDGGPITSELTLDFVGHNQVPSIAALPNGNWAIAYADTGWGDENGSTGISLKILTPAGTNALFGASTIHVNAPHPQVDSQPSVTVLENGFILVTWNTEVSPNSFDVYGRAFTQTGTPVTIDGSNGEFLISSPADNDTFPDVAALNAGRFVTAWTSDDYGLEIAATVKEIIRNTTGDNADDTFTGDVLRDVIASGGGNDTIEAGAGNDIVTAGAGNDTIIEGPGADYVNGGTGDDTTVFSHALDHYLVREWGNQIMVSGAEGTDYLTNVEHLQFADGTINIVDDGNPLFDTPYYLSRNTDVFHAGINALDHFNAVGWHEGRDPNPLFDTSGYLAINQDVAAAGINPLDHYHQTGWQQGRDPSADFDTTLYLIHNPDVAAANIDPLAHYLANGITEGRQAYAAVGQNIAGGFDAEFYLWHNPDVAAAGIDPLFHFNVVGWQEGRDPNAHFDTSGYLSHYGDVAAAGINPFQHYMTTGWQEGRDASLAFDTEGYLYWNPDVAAAGMNPLDHYLHFGIYEGRQIPTDGLWD